MDISSSFQCPKCGKISHNPNDVREGYCGFCHGWTGNETDLAIMRRVNMENVELRAENATLRQHVISLAKGYEDRILELHIENERLRAALEKHHDLLSDELGDLCQTCGTDWLGRDKCR